MSTTIIPEKVRYLLWARSAGRCEFDGCNRPLWRDGLTQIEMNFADVAHIIGDSFHGPRGDDVISKEYCSDVSNIMLMCLDHHRMIDQITETYTDQVLREMKQMHEARVEILTGVTPDKTSHVILYRGRIGQIQPKIDFRDAWRAMAPDNYPSANLPIELGLWNSAFEDKEKDYWSIEVTNLERQYAEKVAPYVNSGKERNHFSVFAIGPQPLLIKLGSLLSDLIPAEIYQLHREPPTWEWQEEPEEFRYIVSEPATANPLVALNLSLSASIDSQRIRKSFQGQNYSEWQMTIENPNNDFLKSYSQLQLFRKEFRRLLDTIKLKHGQNASIHIFPAVPVSIAVEIGRVRQPKADLPFVIYDQNNKTGGFTLTFNIGEYEND
jgi:hypothetical protein